MAYWSHPPWKSIFADENDIEIQVEYNKCKPNCKHTIVALAPDVVVRIGVDGAGSYPQASVLCRRLNNEEVE